VCYYIHRDGRRNARKGVGQSSTGLRYVLIPRDNKPSRCKGRPEQSNCGGSFCVVMEVGRPFKSSRQQFHCRALLHMSDTWRSALALCVWLKDVSDASNRSDDCRSLRCTLGGFQDHSRRTYRFGAELSLLVGRLVFYHDVVRSDARRNVAAVARMIALRYHLLDVFLAVDRSVRASHAHRHCQHTS
jgi:hypothetical protein